MLEQAAAEFTVATLYILCCKAKAFCQRGGRTYAENQAPDVFGMCL